jgi:hypothetical protein
LSDTAVSSQPRPLSPSRKGRSAATTANDSATSPDDIIAQINAEHREVMMSEGKALTHAITCGGLLAQKKAEVQRGKFPEFLEQNCPDISHRTATDYMRLHKHKALLADAGISSGAANFSIRGALALIREKSPKKPRGPQSPGAVTRPEGGRAPTPETALEPYRSATPGPDPDAVVSALDAAELVNIIKRRDHEEQEAVLNGLWETLSPNRKEIHFLHLLRTVPLPRISRMLVESFPRTQLREHIADITRYHRFDATGAEASEPARVLVEHAKPEPITP